MGKKSSFTVAQRPECDPDKAILFERASKINLNKAVHQAISKFNISGNFMDLKKRGIAQMW